MFDIFTVSYFNFLPLVQNRQYEFFLSLEPSWKQKLESNNSERPVFLFQYQTTPL